MRTLTSISPLRVWAVLCACCALILSGIAPAASVAAFADTPRALSRAQSSPATAPPTAPSQFAGADVQIDLVSLSPESVTPGANVSAEVKVTNRSKKPLDNSVLELSLKPSRVTEREEVSAWTARSGDKDLGDRGRAIVTSAPTTLAPGATTTMTVSVPAKDLDLDNDASLWGPRRIALTVRSGVTDVPDAPSEPIVATGGTAHSTLRTFLVWQPSAAPPSIDLAYLAPVTASDPALGVMNPHAFAQELNSGELHDRLAISKLPGVSIWHDPSLTMPAALPLASQSTAASSTDANSAQITPTAPGNPLPIGEANTSSPWKPSEARKDLAAAIDAQAQNHDTLAAPFALADPAALAELPGPARDVIAQAKGKAPVVARVPKSHTSFESVRRYARDADAVMVPAESLTANPDPSVTPSGYGSLSTGGSRVPLLGYDSRLTAISENIGTGDTEARIAEALADTSVVAGQDTDARRVLLVAPHAKADLDPAATQKLLTALQESPWVSPVGAGSMLNRAKVASGTTKLRGSADYLWPGPAKELRAVALGANGTPRHADPVSAPVIPTETLARARSLLTKVTDVRSTLEDPQYANGAFLLAVSALNSDLAAQGRSQGRVKHAEPVVTALASKLRLTMSPNYNLVSAGAGVPFTVRNDFDTPVTVTPQASVSQRIVRIKNAPSAMTVPPRSSTSGKVQLEAITSGTLNISVALATTEGATLQSRSSALSVNPDWENWGTLTLAIAMGVLVVMGVIRAGRTRSDARAPAQRGPEDLSAVDNPHSPSAPEESDTAS